MQVCHHLRNFSNNIAETALKEEERIKIVDDSYSCLVESAKHLRLIDKDGVDEEAKKKDKGRGSEIAEIVLYGIMKHHFNAIPAIPKIFYKQNDKMNAFGDDSVHIVLTKDGDFQIWLGEAKFYNDLEDKRFGEPLDSIAQMIDPTIIRKVTMFAQASVIGHSRENTFHARIPVRFS